MAVGRGFSKRPHLPSRLVQLAIFLRTQGAPTGGCCERGPLEDIASFPPEVNAPVSRIHEHCREWVKEGHDVTRGDLRAEPSPPGASIAVTATGCGRSRTSTG